MVQRFWKKISPYWHVLTFIVSLCVALILWVGDVSSYSGRITKLENNNEEVSEHIANIDGKLDVILAFFKLRYPK